MYRFQSLMMVLLAAVPCGTSLRADDSAKAKPPEKVSVFGVATLEVPSVFQRAPVRSRIIEHEFQAKSGQADDAKSARVTMMAAGGDVAANIQRWKGQFSGGDAAKQKTEEMKLGNWQVYLVDVSGTFAEKMGGGPFAPGPTVERKNHAMTGAILVDPQGRKYFVKMIGPAEVVKDNRESFVEMIKSIED